MGVFVRMCELPSEFRRWEKVQMSCLSVSPPTAFLCFTFYPCFSRTNNDHMSVRLMNYGRYNSYMASVLFFFRSTIQVGSDCAFTCRFLQRLRGKAVSDVDKKNMAFCTSK